MNKSTRASILLGLLVLRLATLIALIISTNINPEYEGKSFDANLSLIEFAYVTVALLALLALIDLCGIYGALQNGLIFLGNFKEFEKQAELLFQFSYCIPNSCLLFAATWLGSFALTLITFGFGIAITYELDIKETSNVIVAVLFEVQIVIATGTFAVVYGALRESMKQHKIPLIKYQC